MKKLLKWGGIAFVVLIVLGMIAGGSGSNDSNSSNSGTASNSSAQEDKAETDQQVEKTYKVGEEVTVKDVKWKVEKATTATTLKGIIENKPTQGKYVVVNVTVENLGKDLKSVTGLKVIDSKGREYTASSESFQNLGAEQMFLLSNLNPNVPQTFADVYEVPADSEGLKLKVGDLSFLGSEEALIDLGL